jgi:hypothetical protein
MLMLMMLCSSFSDSNTRGVTARAGHEAFMPRDEVWRGSRRIPTKPERPTMRCAAGSVMGDENTADHAGGYERVGRVSLQPREIR